MSSATDLPDQLTEQPTAYIVLTGLDVKYNAVHTSIWDSFSNNRRADRVPITFGCLPGDHCYPRCKDNRTSYEWYIPKGILKSNWLDKHLHQVPAVVVIFYELDWDETAWKEKQIECASRVEVVRSSLQGRGTKVAVVLIQKSTPLPPGEDMVAAERAAALCSACDLSAKSLFVLPHTDHLLGYIIRLENAFYDLANSYYHTEARRVKAHKEFLNKTTHQLLYPRHQFKIGFLHELMQDATTAVKHYKQAYTHIHELRSHNTNSLEIKVIGGYINYKICRLCFLNLNTPLDAISQFRKHIDLFKPKVGYPELAFEHSAWMCKQFTLFGDLFDEAISKGLAAIQIQHPGFYYQQAANYAQERRNFSFEMALDEAYPTNDPLAEHDNLEFYGQRSWRQGHQSIDPPDANREKEGILALKHQEAKMDHSWIVIKLLSDAITQFKKYNCPRMKRFLSIQMGEEYYLAKDYTKAATLLTHVTWDYRNHHWKAILTRLLSLTIRCSYLIADVKLYIATCLELMGNHTDISETDRTRIQMNLIRVVSGGPPEYETLPDCKEAQPDIVFNTNTLWMKGLVQSKVHSIEMNNLVSFINCKVRFGKETFLADEPIFLYVYIQVVCPFPIRFTDLSVSFGRLEYDQYCNTSIHTIKGRNDLYFEPHKIKKLEFCFPAHPEDVDKVVQALSVELRLSSETETANSNTVLLIWNGSCNNASVMVNNVDPSVQNAMRNTDGRSWNEIIPCLKTNIQRRKPKIKLEIDHSPTALQNEVYCLNIKVESQEKEVAKSVVVMFCLESGQSDDIFHSTFLGLDSSTILSQTTSKAIELNFGEISPGLQFYKAVYMYSSHIGEKSILCRLSYDINDQITIVNSGQDITHPTTYNCCDETKVKFDTMPAVNIKTELFGSDFSPLTSCEPGGIFTGYIIINCCSPSPIEIKSAKIVINPRQKNISCDLPDLTSVCVKNIILKSEEAATDAIGFRIGLNFVQNRVYECDVGEYKLEWRRYAGENNHMPFVTTSKTFPNIIVKPRPLRARVDLPTFAELEKQLELKYTLTNCTDIVQEIEVSCDASENFMYSGIKLKKGRILPQSEMILRYGLFPLNTGFQALPKINVKILQNDSQETKENYELCTYLEQYLPQDIFIKPTS